MTSGRRQKQMPAEEADYEHDASEDESMVGVPAQQEPATIHRGNELADMQAVAAGAGRGSEYGVGGAFGQPRSSFQSGYDLKAPPIGSTPHEQQAHSLSHREPQTQATLSQRQDNDTESMTESENPSYEGEDEDISPQEAWRYSKAERFFGIGDEGGPANNPATMAEHRVTRTRRDRRGCHGSVVVVSEVACSHSCKISLLIVVCFIRDVLQQLDFSSLAYQKDQLSTRRRRNTIHSVGAEISCNLLNHSIRSSALSRSLHRFSAISLRYSIRSGDFETIRCTSMLLMQAERETSTSQELQNSTFFLVIAISSIKLFLNPQKPVNIPDGPPDYWTFAIHDQGLCTFRIMHFCNIYIKDAHVKQRSCTCYVPALSEQDILPDKMDIHTEQTYVARLPEPVFHQGVEQHFLFPPFAAHDFCSGHPTNKLVMMKYWQMQRMYMLKQNISISQRRIKQTRRDGQLVLNHIYASIHNTAFDDLLQSAGSISEDALSLDHPCRFYDVKNFVDRWILAYSQGRAYHYINTSSDSSLSSLQQDRYIYKQDLCKRSDSDVQGINWRSLGTSREEASAARVAMNAESVVDDCSRRNEAKTETMYQIHSFHGRHRARFAHYQLRNVVAATSRSDIFYASGDKVYSANLALPTKQR
ncbi:hypothetical protein MRB53_041431 [Persea americana]|nr:hypothetical protein MRB53_041431 [Persea americana]